MFHSVDSTDAGGSYWINCGHRLQLVVSCPDRYPALPSRCARSGVVELIAVIPSSGAKRSSVSVRTQTSAATARITSRADGVLEVQPLRPALSSMSLCAFVEHFRVLVQHALSLLSCFAVTVLAQITDIPLSRRLYF